MYFAKVSLEQYMKDVLGNVPEHLHDEMKPLIEQQWKEIKLPTRSSEKSAGYDFHIPYSEYVGEGVTKIYTGVRWVAAQNCFLMLVPRSGLGCKNGFRLRNTVGIVDADYANSSNEGHIMAFVESDEPLFLPPQKGFMQGIIVPYLVVDGDNTTAKRDGGFGSSDENA